MIENLDSYWWPRLLSLLLLVDRCAWAGWSTSLESTLYSLMWHEALAERRALHDSPSCHRGGLTRPMSRTLEGPCSVTLQARRVKNP